MPPIDGRYKEAAVEDATAPYAGLTPDCVLDALDSVGLRGDGRLLQLNSYENRVFQVMLEDGGVVVAKFYRPGRWTDPQIQEEHDFAAALSDAEIPVVAPMALPGGTAEGQTLAQVEIDGAPFRLAAYPRRSGHGPELDQPETLRWLGRFIGRLHAVGAQQPFLHRRTLDATTFGHAPVARLLAMAIIPPAQLGPWQQTAEQSGCTTNYLTTTGSLWKWHSSCTSIKSETDGEVVFNSAENYRTKVTTTSTVMNQTRTTTRVVQSNWLGGDCGDIKPVTANSLAGRGQQPR